MVGGWGGAALFAASPKNTFKSFKIPAKTDSQRVKRTPGGLLPFRTPLVPGKFIDWADTLPLDNNQKNIKGALRDGSPLITAKSKHGAAAPLPDNSEGIWLCGPD